MRISLKLFASLAVHLPVEVRASHRLELDVETGTTVADVIQRQGIPPGNCAMVMVDGHWVAPIDRASRAMVEGEVLAIWPPVAGG